MTTLPIDYGSIGFVWPNPDAITRIEVTAMPAQGWEGAIGALTLLDNSGQNPRQLFNASADNIGRLVGTNIAVDPGRIGVGPVLSSYPIEFGSLLVESVPRRRAGLHGQPRERPQCLPKLPLRARSLPDEFSLCPKLFELARLRKHTRLAAWAVRRRVRLNGQLAAFCVCRFGHAVW
jgi:hypothetical protein